MSKKALVADTSALARRFYKNFLQEQGFMVEVAKDSKEAMEKSLLESFDLIILDSSIEENLEVAKAIMQKNPTRILLVGADDGDLAFRAQEVGALAFVQKPRGKILAKEDDFIKLLRHKIKEVMGVSKLSLRLRKQRGIKESIKTDHFVAREDRRYVLIGASTGGPKLIEAIARSLPSSYPYPVCVVQHMPTNFTGKFAQRLDSISQIEVVEASHGLELKAAQMIIGKGGKHLHFRREADQVFCKLVPNTMKRFFVPSVDEMFLSALETMNPKNILAILLTGIGDDGADGMVALRMAGAYTIAESEESATVYGMPKEAFVRGGAMKVLHFNDILEEIIAYGSSHGTQNGVKYRAS